MKPEPVAWLYQHDETGRTLLTEQPPDRVAPNDLRRWTCIGGLHLESALGAARTDALEEAAKVCDDHFHNGWTPEELASAIRAMKGKENSDE